VPRVLVVEDSQDIADLIRRYFERAGHTVEHLTTGHDVVAHARRMPADLVVLDVMLPGMDGMLVCQALRGDAATAAIPIIMLTARGEEADRIVGLELGADDYITKPFSPRELAARVRTVLRRSRPGEPRSRRIDFGDVVLEHETREARKAGVELRLTTKEFDLLWFLASHPRRVFSRDQLMASVWGYEPVLDTGTVTVHVRRLREKIEDQPSEPRHLQTVWGVGYRLVT
jgi:DNA-binding response OmpR family regulator